ncbi:MAG: hypothetical protein J6038_00860 [Bacilli bacterium]|nr:hypothetical protein [Bacilli bacterium]
MTQYFQYLAKMIVAFFQNVGDWFRLRWYEPFTAWPGYFDTYSDIYNLYAEDFGFGGWFFFVLFAVFLVILIGGILFLLGWLIRKYVKFYKKELDKEKLVEEVETLQTDLYNSEMSSRKILGLQVSALGGTPIKGVGAAGAVAGAGEAEGEAAEVSDADKKLRFPRCSGVDEKYESLESRQLVMAEEDAKLSLKGVCERFRAFAASQMRLYYTPETVRAFWASMGTSKVIILEGISGTGKTSLPYCMGRFLKNPSTICSVQPSWHDRSELLGFYNDFTKRFTETDFLRAVYEAGYRADPNLIVLDEMNLARIEYYFAEFLSVMEMPNTLEWNIDLISSKDPNDPKHIVEGKLHIEQNIWFIGTANNDDSTFTITDKVYDRAMSLFFDNKGIAFESEYADAMPMTYEWLNGLFTKAKLDYPLSQKTKDKFAQLDDFVIAHFKLAFGNRIMKQMESFCPCYVACGGTELEAVDYIFESKILKKFEVLNVAFLRDELLALDKELTNLFGKNEFKKSRLKIAGFLKAQG